MSTSAPPTSRRWRISTRGWSGSLSGRRPPFSFGGAWLYLGARAVLHLIETDDPPAGVEPRIEHFAFRASGLEDFIARLEASSVPYRRSTVPGIGLEQLHFNDPDGNHVEVGFVPGDDASS